jgi:aryl-alcohol dehydrogenase-like predicted oxidoreductase
MRYRPLGQSGIDVSIVSIGTWALGGTDWGRVDDRDGIKAIHRALDLGVNLFDTAPIYGNGHAEVVLGRALANHRRDAIVATKCGPIVVRPGLVRTELSAAAIAAQCEGSLRRLGTDWIDLLQIHWSDASWPIEDTVIALGRLVREGKVRAIGVSNHAADELARGLSAGPLASVQERYSLLSRSVESAILPACRERSVGFLAYEPLGRGLLTGKFDERFRFPPGDVRASDPRFRGEAFRGHLAAADRLVALAGSHGVVASQLAVAWVLSRPGVTSAICGAKTAAQVACNVAAAGLDPDRQTLWEAESIFEAFQPDKA